MREIIDAIKGIKAKLGYIKDEEIELFQKMILYNAEQILSVD